MPKTGPFEGHVKQYEQWFEKNNLVYKSELEAVRLLLPEGARGVEIGAGTGRFSSPLGIRIGIEPSRAMANLARKRGINLIFGVAENLPLKNDSCDFALMVTTICFVDELEQSFREAWRIVKPGGFLIVGFVDRESPLGKTYEKNKQKSVFYRNATFYSMDEVVSCMKNLGFENLEFTQTIFHKPGETRELEPVQKGYGEGSFVVVRGQKGKSG